jgi:hypothetical protein
VQVSVALEPDLIDVLWCQPGCAECDKEKRNVSMQDPDLLSADALIDQAEKLKAGIRAKVEHPVRVVKRKF